MIFPVLVFWLLCPDNADMQRGLAIPMATDIAFSLGVLSVFSTRVPTGLKVFLAALAVADDLGGIIVIALFYSSDLHVDFLLLSLLCVAIMMIGNKLKYHNKFFYLLTGLVLWYELPASVATHWGATDVANGYSSKAFAVFGLPLILLAAFWFCVWFSAKDPKNKE